MPEIHRRRRGETQEEWRGRKEALPEEAIVEIFFAKALPDSASLQLVLFASTYANTEILTDKKDRIVGFRAPKSVWKSLMRG